MTCSCLFVCFCTKSSKSNFHFTHISFQTRNTLSVQQIEVISGYCSGQHSSRNVCLFPVLYTYQSFLNLVPNCVGQYSEGKSQPEYWVIHFSPSMYTQGENDRCPNTIFYRWLEERGQFIFQKIMGYVSIQVIYFNIPWICGSRNHNHSSAGITVTDAY